eukprot:665506-Lingulodinium_polyedra.AAC.1
MAQRVGDSSRLCILDARLVARHYAAVFRAATRGGRGWPCVCIAGSPLLCFVETRAFFFVPRARWPSLPQHPAVATAGVAYVPTP